MNQIDLFEREQQKKRVPVFRPGDTVRVHIRVVEGDHQRTQVFEGIVIKRQGSGLKETFTVRKISFGVGVERTFLLHSPMVAKIEVKSHGDVNRAKLYYLRERVGKKAKVRPRARVRGKEEEAIEEEEAPSAAETKEEGEELEKKHE